MQTEDFDQLYELEEDLWWFAGMREITASLLGSFVRKKPPVKILDNGCGTGGMIAWLQRYAAAQSVFGIDLESDAVRYSRQRSSNVAQASATRLPFTDASFDMVTSFDVIVQIPGDGDVSAIEEMYRVLQPGGVGFIRAAACKWMWSSHDSALGTQRRYSLDELVQMLRRAGFRVDRATYANSILLPVAAFRRLVLKRFGLAPTGSDVVPFPPSLRWLNPLLKKLLTFEARILQYPSVRLPIGLSIICIFTKP
jgi:SAM-dependent methyltransferase